MNNFYKTNVNLNYISAVSWSKSGDSILIGGSNGELELWDCYKKKKIIGIQKN